MEVTNTRRLHRFVQSRPDAYSAVARWLEIVDAASWRNPHEVEGGYLGARHLRGSRMNFKLGGNKYRLIALMDYANQWVQVRFVGVHDEYEGIDALRV